MEKEVHVPLSAIHADKNQPRTVFDETAINELAESIRSHGILQRIGLVKKGDKYEVIYGNRRLIAAKIVNENYHTKGVTDVIPAKVYEDLSEDDRLEIQLTENLLRVDVHPMEEAKNFVKLAKLKPPADIGAAMGKTARFVKDRMRLVQLTDKWQAAFLANVIDISDALKVAAMPEKAQTMLYKNESVDRHVKEGSQVDLSDWTMKKYMGILDEATWDLSAEFKGLPDGCNKCEGCKFNSATAALFETDGEVKICSNLACYEKKAEKTFKQNLKVVIEDPNAIVITTDYTQQSESKQAAEQLGVDKVYTRGMYIPVEKPAKKDIEEGKVLKAFVVAGPDEGKFTYVKMPEPAKPKAAAIKEKAAEGKLTETDISEELKRIQEKEKRNAELDVNKIHKATLDAFDEKIKEKAFSMPLVNLDNGIVVHLLYLQAHETTKREIRKLKGWPKEPSYHGYNEEYFRALSKITPKQVAEIVRRIVVYSHSALHADVQLNHTMFRIIAKYAGVDVAGIETAQKAEAALRHERAQGKIKELKKLSSAKK